MHTREHSVLSLLPVAVAQPQFCKKIFVLLPSVRFGRITLGSLASDLSQPGPLLSSGPDEGTAYFKEELSGSKEDPETGDLHGRVVKSAKYVIFRVPVEHQL